MVKRLQKNSNYAQYDLDNDGTVSDEELEHIKEIKKLEGELRKHLHIGWYGFVYCYDVYAIYDYRKN